MRWKPISFARSYQIGDTGLVRRGREPMVIQVCKKYRRVALRCDDGVRRQCLVARLVARHFIGPPPKANSTVDHIDCNTENDTPANLRWLDPSENSRRAQLLRGALDAQAAQTIRERYAAGERLASLAAEYKRSKCTIHGIVHGLTHKHAGGPIAQAQNPKRFMKGRTTICPEVLTDAEILALRQAAAAGEPRAELLQRCKRTYKDLIRILRHQRYRHVGGPKLANTYGALRHRRFDVCSSPIPASRR